MNILSKIREQRELQLMREYEDWSRPSLIEALAQPGIQIIGEIKRASPSKGQIATDDFDLLKQAQYYVNNKVAGISILTEEANFKGDNAFIPEVVKAFPEVPVLRKDFIYTPFQVAHAKHLGASAILLIVAMLEQDELLMLHTFAQTLGLEVLVEVHDEEELMRAFHIPTLQLLGINNRNLKNFEVSLKTTERLLKAIPAEALDEIIIVSESGYHSKEDIAYAESLGVDALLIGEALMKGQLF